MIGVRHGLSTSVVALVVMLSVLDAGMGIELRGWMISLACGLALSAAAASLASVYEVRSLGPADVVTVSRATLACGVAALVADSFLSDGSGQALVVLAAVALALDAVDGRVARRTGTASAFGARLDGEADAFLMLVLSVHVASSFGSWVLMMGAARYAFGMTGWWLPWMRAELPPRHWRKVVTATAGVALVFAASGAGPVAATYGALLVALVLLTESFGRDVWWLWCRRPVRTRVPGTDVGVAIPHELRS